MVLKFETGKEKMIEAVLTLIKPKMHAKNNFIAFAKQFYGSVALEDLKLWTVDDLFANLTQFWSLMEKRTPHETKIHIYNPNIEEHGWTTPYTIIEILLEDMPFLVDSIRILLDRLNIVSHLTIHLGGIAIERNHAHELVKVFSKAERLQFQGLIEAPLWFQIDKQNDKQFIQQLQSRLCEALEDTRVAVEDWNNMRQKVKAMVQEMDGLSRVFTEELLNETKAFLNWIDDHHFTFLGMCDYRIKKKGTQLHLEALEKTGLGILRASLVSSRHQNLKQMMPESCQFSSALGPLVMSKTNALATVHRNVYTDYIGIKRFNEKGQPIGELGIIGLYTSAAYNTNPKHIPFLRHKVEQVMRNSDLNPKSHAGKVLFNILETLPRDDLIQASEDELLEMGMGIFHLQERRRIRLFVRKDIYGRFISCLVYIPRDRVNAELCMAMQQVFAKAVGTYDITYHTHFTESILARIHFLIRLPVEKQETTQKNICDFKAVEQQLIELGRSWYDLLRDLLTKHFSEEEANQLYQKYKHVFPNAYCDNYKPQEALLDIRYMESLKEIDALNIHFYREDNDPAHHFRMKVFQHHFAIPLSDILPIVENLGMQALSEKPYSLNFSDGLQLWISDFSLQYKNSISFDLKSMQTLFQTAFLKIWTQEAENDGFNALILTAGLNWREVSVLRAFSRYFKQIGFTFSQDYIASTLVKHADISKQCLALFQTRFDPAYTSTMAVRNKAFEKLAEHILDRLEKVKNLEEDKILRQFIQIIRATLRTNYYQTNLNKTHKPILSFKLDGHLIPNLPKPYPLYEIYLYSPRVEGVHLRGGKVSRGGIRWSDRREDFRTEILGLMKAQQVKNAIIVPSGAKGGFFPKQLESCHTREEILNEALYCYQLFIRGLLDITDNYVNRVMVNPPDVLCYDKEDPYLVVAADKGTATFSDYANEISKEYGFWLNDAFASGGSVGYDHKKIGITARGAWESVKRHFYEMNIDPETRDFTVVGIGDMSGDVFGNGMLLSNRIKLVAAFNHAHIFIDPNPNTEISFTERERLFHLPRSTWMDYDTSRISKGGGVFDRQAKSIPVSKEMKHLLSLTQQNIEPNELILSILKAKVDLLWSAGIGTFVKASDETDLEVGDKTNDPIRVHAGALRCKMVGEGGNLGFTQKARVEYHLLGGLIYTDFIDNSAGVSCSDKEVNIKILLNQIVEHKGLTLKQRNSLLSEMTEEVAALVLEDNMNQTKAVSLSAAQPYAIDLHIEYIHWLESHGKLNRQIESIPEDKALLEHKLQGKGLGAPSIAVLHAYSKIMLKEALLKTALLEDSCLDKVLAKAFPETIYARFMRQIKSHPLRRELLATKLTNMIVDEMGFAFVFRIQKETNAEVDKIISAYIVARTVLGLEKIWSEISQLGFSLKNKNEKTILTAYQRLVRRVVRWLMRQSQDLNIQQSIDRYIKGIQSIKTFIPHALQPKQTAQYEHLYHKYKSWDISEAMAHEFAMIPFLFAALDVIEAAFVYEQNIEKIATIYFEIGERLDLDWIREQVISHPTASTWEVFSRDAIRDDLDYEQRFVTEAVIQCEKERPKTKSHCVDIWFHLHQTKLTYWNQVITGLKSAQTLHYTMFFVALRQLHDFVRHIGSEC